MEIHLTKKDFKIDWFSGTGAGGQHRNKHQNCCRIVHIDTGIKAQGTASKERVMNRRFAFKELAKRLINHFFRKDFKKVNTKVIRNYNASKNIVHDRISGFRQPYKVVIDNIGPMIEKRRETMLYL